MHTFANATLSFGGRTLPLESVSFELSDDPGDLVLPTLPSTLRPEDYRFTFTSELHDAGLAMGAIATAARQGAIGGKGLARQMRRLFPRSVHCWKCADGRTRAHHRRCDKRGHGANARSGTAA